MKIALITDTHFGARNDNLNFNEYFYDFYEGVFFPYLQQNNIKHCIHLGDLMDRRKYVSYRPNFINYTYRQEMISDGIENCLQYIHNFDPDKSKNPFSYFTQIIYYAFIRRIQKEKKQAHIKNKMIEKRSYDTFTTMEGDDTPYQVRGFDPDLMLPDEDVYKPKKKETTQKTNGLENFMELDD